MSYKHKAPNVAKTASYYAVRVGRRTGVFRNWSEVQAQIIGFPKPDFKKFPTLEAANAYFKDTNIMYERKVAGGTGDRPLWGPRPLPEVFATSRHSLWLFTDGSCKDNSNVAHQVRPAGWGVVAVKCTCLNELDLPAVEVIDEFCGRVAVDPRMTASQRFLGAEHGSNNTGELTAVAEALLWLRRLYDPACASFVNHVGSSVPTAELRSLPVLINCDSVYAANAVLGVHNGLKNRALIDRTRAVFDAVRAAAGPATGLVFAHVRGHSAHPWNDRADQLAELGGASQGPIATAPIALPPATGAASRGSTTASVRTGAAAVGSWSGSVAVKPRAEKVTAVKRKHFEMTGTGTVDDPVLL
jgi:ribonuclease HI